MKLAALFHKSLLCCASAGLLAVAASCSLFEEDLLDLSGGDPSDISVAELYKRMQTATDPDGVYAKAKTYRLIQEVESVDAANSKNFYSAEVLFKTPDQVKQISLRNGKPFSILIYNNGKAWYIDPDNRKSTPVPPGTGLNLITAFSKMLKPGNNFASIFQDVQIDVNYESGRKYYRLICRLADPNIAPYVFYIDAETYLTRKFETVLYGDDGAGRKFLYTAITEDYHWISKVKMARKSLITVAGKTDESKLVSFVMNVEIPDSEFQPSVPWNHKAK